LKKQTYTTRIRVFQVTLHGFVNKSSSDFFFIKRRPMKLILTNTIEISFLFNIRHNI